LFCFFGVFPLSNFSWRRADREEGDREREALGGGSPRDWTGSEHSEGARSPRHGARPRRRLGDRFEPSFPPARLGFCGIRPRNPAVGEGEDREGGGDMGVGAEPKEDAAGTGSAAAAEEGASGKEEKAAAVSCSICLDAVLAATGERSTARLQCGHEFHLGECP